VLRARLATAAVALPTLVWLIFYAPAWAFSGMILAFTAVGLSEYVDMAMPDHRRVKIFAVAVGLGLAWTVVVHRSDALGLVLVVSLVAGLFLALADEDIGGAVSRLAHGLLAALYVGFLLPHVVRLRLMPEGGERWVFLALACAFATDSAAYFGGRWAGRTKLFPRVSPSKTLEGAVSGVVGSVLVAYLIYVFLPPPSLHVAEALWIGIAIAFLTETGDLVESMIKRAYGAKDSGWIFPGHGGVLDRIDGLVLPFVFTYYWNAGLGL